MAIRDDIILTFQARHAKVGLTQFVEDVVDLLLLQDVPQQAGQIAAVMQTERNELSAGRQPFINSATARVNELDAQIADFDSSLAILNGIANP